MSMTILYKYLNPIYEFNIKSTSILHKGKFNVLVSNKNLLFPTRHYLQS